MGTVIDLFTRKAVRDGETVPEELVAAATDGGEVDESDLIEQFRESLLNDFLNAVKGVEEAETIEDLDYWLNETRDQVAKWPRMRNSGGRSAT